MTDNRLMISANTKERIPEYLFTETGEINLTDAKKILSVTAEAAVNSVDALNNELRVNVTTTFKVIYDSPAGINSCSVKVDGNRSIMVEGVNADTRAVVYACVQDCDYTGANSIKAKCTIMLSGWYVKDNPLSFLTTEMEGIYCKTALIKVENVDILPTSKLTLTYSNEARMPISKMLDLHATVFVNNVFPGNGSFQIEGEIALRMIALSDNGEVMNQTFTNPFTTEILDESLKADTTIDVIASECGMEYTLSAQDSRAFVTDIKLALYPIASDMREVESVVDAYSTTHDLKIEEKKHSLDSLFCLRTVRDKVSANVKAQNGVNDVMCITGAMLSYSTNLNNGILTAEGVICATVIYLDDENRTDSIKVELPFQTVIAKDFDCKIDISSQVMITGMFARVRTASEIEVSVEITVNASGKRTTMVNLISDIEMADAKEVDDVAITLYIVKPNQSMWEVAKELNTSEATIINQNPDLKLPVKAGDKVVLYKEINFEI